MNFLANENFPFDAVKALRSLYAMIGMDISVLLKMTRLE
jgi:hypothetical protein